MYRIFLYLFWPNIHHLKTKEKNFHYENENPIYCCCCCFHSLDDDNDNGLNTRFVRLFVFSKTENEKKKRKENGIVGFILVRRLDNLIFFSFHIYKNIHNQPTNFAIYVTLNRQDMLASRK